MERNTHGFMIKTISDPATQLGTMLLACKMMQKCKVASVPAYVIQLAGHCEKGVYLNWSQLLCNEFLENMHEAQDHGREFCYS